MVTGFYSETTESEATQLFGGVGMDIGNARIECTAKPITHAFTHFKNDGERNKFTRSANMLKKELRERKITIIRSMDAEERGSTTKEWSTPNTKSSRNTMSIRINNHELDNEIRNNQWSHCCEDSTKWKLEIHQIPRC